MPYQQDESRERFRVEEPCTSCLPRFYERQGPFPYPQPGESVKEMEKIVWLKTLHGGVGTLRGPGSNKKQQKNVIISHIHDRQLFQ